MREYSEILTKGNLSVFHLKRIWQKTQKKLEGNTPPDLLPNESELDRVVLDSIGLGIVEPFQYLFHKRPTFLEFEAWITETLGSPLTPETVEKTNRYVMEFLEEKTIRFPCSGEIENPVFDEQDIEFWNENGYIILKNAIPIEDAIASEMAVWDFLGFDPKSPQPWYQRAQTFWVDLFQHPVLNRNRNSARIKKAFAQLWGSEELIASVDRTSFNPPLKDGVNHSGPSRLHWDASIALPMRFDVLGILYLNDVAENQGAFRCVPGFHLRMESWIAGLPENTNPRDENLESLGVVSVGGNAGDLIIWRQDLPHGSGLNLADKPRIAQYITMYPPVRDINPVWK